MPATLIHNVTIVNEGTVFKGDVLIENGFIQSVCSTASSKKQKPDSKIFDATGLYLFPGIIDVHVHFREPGLTHKGDLLTESKAAVAGGVTSIMDMPNTHPPALTCNILEGKYRIAAGKSLVNFSFYLGASENNLDEVLALDTKSNCGVKIFLGTSTGNMAVTDRKLLEKLFSECKALIAAHCEDEEIIRENTVKISNRFGKNIPIEFHPVIRDAKACIKSSSFAIEMAKKYGTRLHLAHISTEQEANLLAKLPKVYRKKITAETCVHYLWFCDEDYKAKGATIRWNPSIKTKKDSEGLLTALRDGHLDLVASDHAPHTAEEKKMPYFQCPSGAPMVQHIFPAMLELYHRKKISLEFIAEKMCHAPARCFGIEKRGFIRKGYYADITLVNPNSPWKVEKSNILYKCGWSPMEGETFHSKVTHTFINGNMVYGNGKFDDSVKGMRLLFNRKKG